MYVDSVIHPVNLLPPNIFGFQVFMVSSASQQMVLVHLLLLLTECATRMGEQSYVLQGNHIQKLGGSLERPHFLASKAFPLQAWTGPEGSRKLKAPRFRDNGTGWW